jgi:hypothetical protein
MLIRSSLAASLALVFCCAAGGTAERAMAADPAVVALNPQPEPPGRTAHVSVTYSSRSTRSPNRRAIRRRRFATPW